MEDLAGMVAGARHVEVRILVVVVRVFKVEAVMMGQVAILIYRVKTAAPAAPELPEASEQPEEPVHMRVGTGFLELPGYQVLMAAVDKGVMAGAVVPVRKANFLDALPVQVMAGAVVEEAVKVALEGLVAKVADLLMPFIYSIMAQVV